MFCKALLEDGKARVYTVAPEATLGEAAGMLTSHRIGALMVVGAAGNLIGIFSERDLTRAVAKHGGDAPGLWVAQFMTTVIATCTPDDDLQHVMHLMDQRHIRHVPVVEDDRPIGMVSIRDVIGRLLEETASERDMIRDYVSSASC